MPEQKQKTAFLKSEGNAWFKRNAHAYQSEKADSILNMLSQIEHEPKEVLEIGCSLGKRLAKIQTDFGANCYGIDPSSQAIMEGLQTYPQLALSEGTADHLDFDSNSFDTIIFGFCLYLCDREDLFKIAYEVDRCLKDNGVIIISDFMPPFAFKNEYCHLEGIQSFKMNHSKMFLWNPYYFEIGSYVTTHSGTIDRHIPNERIAVTALMKSTKSAYANNPF